MHDGDPTSPGAPNGPPDAAPSAEWPSSSGSEPAAAGGPSGGEPTAAPEPLAIEDGVTVAAPSVVAVMVTRDAGAWLESALESLGGQDYPDLTVLVLDADSTHDPTARVAAVLPGAYVRRLEDQPGFAAAANEALALVEGAAFYLVCHDDVVLEPDAVRLMVEEAYRSNAAILGPKLVDDADPRILLEVGNAVDRFGAPHSEIEPGELDQEQHDAVRDVFFVSSVAMLVRVDLFAELGGFDPAAYPGSEALDLCWRARIAGARVMVAPDAKARHRRAASRRGIGVPTAFELERGRLRSVLVAYSRLSLVWMVPWILLHTVVESLAFLVTGRPQRSFALWRAWFWNLRRISDLRRVRTRAQAVRRVPDRELRALQTRGSARARRFLTRRFKAEETISLIGDTGRAVVDRAQTNARQPIFVALGLAMLVFVVGSRGLYFEGIPQVGQFANWISLSDLAAGFGSGWRDTMLGSPTPAPPLLALMAALTTVLVGAAGLAQTLVVLACLPLGVIGIMRLIRAVSGEMVSAAAGGLAYVLLPVWRNAIANGRLGPLLMLALAPFLVHLLLRAAGARTDGTVQTSQFRRCALGLTVLGAIVTAFYPPALLLGLGLALALALAAPLTGALVLASRTALATALAALGAFVLLFPWPLAVALGRPDAGSIAFGFRSRLDLGEILRMSSGPAGARWSAIGVLLGGLLALAIARGPRLIWAIRAWALALVGFLATWIPARFTPDMPVPAPEATLTVFALGVAAAVGIGVAAFIEDLRGQHFGWRQGASLLAFVAVVISSFGYLGDSITGRWHAPRRDWPSALAFATNDDRGSFRVLWVGDPAVVPFDAVVDRDGLGYVLTVDGAGDATDSLRAPVTEADEVLGEAITLTREGRTARLGRLLAPMAVRYVIVPDRVGPRSGTRARPPADLVSGLEDQVDLAELVMVDDDLQVFENTAWVPMQVLVSEVPGDDPERFELDPVEPVGPHEGVDGDDGEEAEPSSTAGVVLWSQAANDGWEATANGQRLERSEAFGWANAFELESEGLESEGSEQDVEITWQEQAQRNATVVVQLLIVAALATAWWRRRRASVDAGETEGRRGGAP